MKYRVRMDVWCDRKIDRDRVEAVALAEVEKVQEGKRHGWVEEHKCFHDEEVMRPCIDQVITVIGHGGKWAEARKAAAEAQK